MGAKYCTIDQLAGTENDTINGYLEFSSPEDRAEADQMIEKVSRLVDFYITGDPNSETFKPAPAQAAAKTLRGNGLSALPLPTHVPNSITEVVVNANYTLPNYTVENGSLIIVDDYNNQLRRYAWREGLAITITARWGYAETPEPIQLACMAWTAEWLRDDGGVFTGTFGNMEFSKLLYKKAIPPQVELILGEYKRQFERSERARKGFVF